MREYWDAIVLSRGTLLRLLVVFELLAVLIVFVTPVRYEADAKIVASDFSVSYSPSQQSGLGAALAGASLLGLTDRPASLFSQFRALMISPAVAGRLLKNPELVGMALFPDEWDSTRHQWKKPSGLVFGAGQLVKRVLGIPTWAPPDRFRIAEYLSRNLVVLQDINSIASVSIRTKSPALSSAILNAILQETADLMRDAVEGDLQNQIVFMDQALKDTASVEARQAQITLATEAQKKIILIRSGSPIGAKIIEPVATDPRPVSPDVRLIFAFATLASFVLFMAIVLYRLKTGYSPATSRECADGTERGGIARAQRAIRALRTKNASGADWLR